MPVRDRPSVENHEHCIAALWTTVRSQAPPSGFNTACSFLTKSRAQQRKRNERQSAGGYRNDVKSMRSQYHSVFAAQAILPLLQGS
jgi:hypothetical protein